MKWSRKLIPNQRNKKQIIAIQLLLKSKTKSNPEYLNYGNKGHFVLYDLEKDNKIYPAVTFFKDNSAKSKSYIFNRGFGSRLKWINNNAKTIDAIESKKEAKRKLQEERKLENLEKFKPGKLIVTSGGYEQTNVSFYQIIESKGKKSVVVRPIKSKIVREKSNQPMSGYKSPIKDSFTGDEFSCIITQHGVSISKNETAYNTTSENEEHYYSWSY